MAIDLDYTQVDISDDGATFGTAVRTQFQNAQADLGNRAEDAESGTISGSRTFTGGATFFGTPGKTVTFIGDPVNASASFNFTGVANFEGIADFKSDVKFRHSLGTLQFEGNPTWYGDVKYDGDVTLQGGAKLHAKGSSGDVTVAEITMEEIQSGNSSANGLKIVKVDGGRFINIIPVHDGVESSDGKLSIDTRTPAYNLGNDAFLKATKFRLTRTPPSSASDSGVKYEMATDSNYIYVCVKNNTWKRAALSTW